MQLTASEKMNYQFLLLTHIVCADDQIHSEESKALREIAQNAQMGVQTIKEMEKILSQDENLISFEDIARKISPGEQTEVIQKILAIARKQSIKNIQKNYLKPVAYKTFWIQFEYLWLSMASFGDRKL